MYAKALIEGILVFFLPAAQYDRELGRGPSKSVPVCFNSLFASHEASAWRDELCISIAMPDQSAPSTLFDLLRLRAVEHADSPLYTYLLGGETEEQTYSYADLDRRAREIGGWLQDRGAAGKRVLLVYPQGLDYIAAFFGCIYAGAVAVPAYPPRRNRRAVRICSMVTDADVSIALTTADLFDQMRPGRGGRLRPALRRR